MSSQNRARFIVDLTGNVAQQARRFGASIRSLGADGSRSMRVFRGAMGLANGALDKFDNRLTGLVTGGGMMMLAKNVGNTQQQLTEVSTRYNMVADQAAAFDSALWKNAADYKMVQGELLSAANIFLEKTNSPDAAIAHMDKIAAAIKGIGLSSEASGQLVASMWNDGIRSSEEMMKVLDGVASLSVVGTGNINEQVNGILSLTKGTSWNRSGEMLELLKMQRLGSSEFGSDAQVTAALQQVYAATKDREKLRTMERNGVKVWKDKSKGELVSPNELMLSIGERSKYKERNLKTIFDGDTLKFAKSFADPEKQAQLKAPVDTIDGLVNEKATRNVQTFNGALQSLMTAGERWANLKLARPLQEFADAINALSPEELQSYAKTLTVTAGAIAGAVVARKGYRLGKAGYDFLKGPKGGGGGAIGGLGGALGAQPVFVTNWPIGGLGGGAKGSPMMGGSGGGMVAKAGFVGMMTAAVTPYVDDALVAVFGDSERFNKIRSAETWSDFGNAIIGREPKVGNGSEDLDPLTGNSSAWDNAFKNNNDKPLVAEQRPQTPPEGKIQLEVKTADGVSVRATQVQSKGVGVSVNTGNTYSGGY
ncbi:hypothetical protein SOASR030_37230 [Leminorella grimontii]|uniref:Tape measure protein n=3 Tax=Leminorella grimontii TaxID=82981 RepID=A0AAV5N668_9GAMM|nr:hypothetical protein [Leminorella grimontii]GKX57611.1 hypothetical protein SOASR030_37230 [Leminorella grimontii]VFS55829.1 Uncharacterised protein [Leminorella grimontii]